MLARKDSSPGIAKDKENTDQQKSTKAATGRPEAMDNHTLAKGIEDEMDKTIHFNHDETRSNLNSEQYKTWKM